MQNTTDTRPHSTELNLSGFGLSYDDIQRGKAGDFAYVREKVRSRWGRFILWGRIIGLLLLGIIIADFWFRHPDLTIAIDWAVAAFFLFGPQLFAKRQQATLEKRIAAVKTV